MGIQQMLGGGSRDFLVEHTTPGTYTWTAPYAGTYFVHFEMCGAGATGASGLAGGGGAEALVEATVNVTGGTEFTMVVGATSDEVTDGEASSLRITGQPILVSVAGGQHPIDGYIGGYGGGSYGGAGGNQPTNGQAGTYALDWGGRRIGGSGGGYGGGVPAGGSGGGQPLNSIAASAGGAAIQPGDGSFYCTGGGGGGASWYGPGGHGGIARAVFHIGDPDYYTSIAVAGATGTAYGAGGGGGGTAEAYAAGGAGAGGYIKITGPFTS